ncbi:MAG: hypothetical protein AAF404_18865, partial [Pseudomonadota bacterium]
PLAVTCNKLLLCHLANHNRYLETLFAHHKQHYRRSKMRRVKRFGYESLSIDPDDADGGYLISGAEHPASTVVA